ncbi:MAG: cupin domain-containing protein [Opitutaceae bacterium]|nr:cupin domain-containing protein [Opitutaceae bacterium]
MLKSHHEFYQLDLTSGWEAIPGYPDGIRHKILSGTLDEQARAGIRTRLLRFDPGAFTTQPFEHEYWEEVFQLSGDLSVGGQTFGPMTYACRPPHVPHGPFSSHNGCLLLELHFFNPLAGPAAS